MEIDKIKYKGIDITITYNRQYYTFYARFIQNNIECAAGDKHSVVELINDVKSKIDENINKEKKKFIYNINKADLGVDGWVYIQIAKITDLYARGYLSRCVSNYKDDHDRGLREYLKDISEYDIWGKL